MTNRNCSNCGFAFASVFNDEHFCRHYTGPYSGKAVSVADCCEEHATEDEKAAQGIVFTSVDDAKFSIARADLPVLKIALSMEEKMQKRATLIKKLQSRIKKMEKANAKQSSARNCKKGAC